MISFPDFLGADRGGGLAEGEAFSFLTEQVGDRQIAGVVRTVIR